MPIQDLAFNPVDSTPAQFLGFRPSTRPRDFPHDIYSYLIEPVRQQDRDEGGELVRRFLLGMQDEFEATDGRIRSLLNYYDPEFTSASALDHLRWLVGITGKLDDLAAGLSDVSLRRLIANAAFMWPTKGSEIGLVVTLERLVGRQARIINYFEARMISDEVELGLQGAGFDPWIINQPGVTERRPPTSVVDNGDHLLFDLTSIFGPGNWENQVVRIEYLPTRTVQFRKSFWNGTVTQVTSSDLLGQSSPASTEASDYTMQVDPDEYIMDLFAQNDTADRDLAERVIAELRPANERIFMWWIDFVDQWITRELRWDVVSGVVFNQFEQGFAILTAGVDPEGVMESVQPNQDDWTDYTIGAAVIFPTSEWAELRFYMQDQDNFYAMRIDPTSIGAVVTVDKVVSGIRTTLDSADVPIFHLNQGYLVSVRVEATPAGVNNIKALLDEDLILTVQDSTFRKGRVGFAVDSGSQLLLIFILLFQTPLVPTRIGF